MKRALCAALAACFLLPLLLFATVVPAHADALNVGAAFATLAPYIDSVVGALLTALVGWVLYLAKTRLNVSIDDSARDALQTWLLRQASSLVADGAVKLNGLQVQVSNPALASAANVALQDIPDALKAFGLTPDKLQQMIVDKIPHVPAVAAAVAATAPANVAKAS